jgi:hypothetical protein
MRPAQVSRSLLFRFMGWFAMANALVLALIGLRYFSGFSSGGTLLSWLYLVMIYPSHHVLLAVIPLFALLTPLVFLSPGKRRVLVLAVLIYALLIAVIMLDSLLWADSRFHINALTIQILGWQSWVFVTVIFIIALVFESLLAQRVWHWVGLWTCRSSKKQGSPGGQASFKTIERQCRPRVELPLESAAIQQRPATQSTGDPGRRHARRQGQRDRFAESLAPCSQRRPTIHASLQRRKFIQDGCFQFFLWIAASLLGQL